MKHFDTKYSNWTSPGHFSLASTHSSITLSFSHSLFCSLTLSVRSTLLSFLSYSSLTPIPCPFYYLRLSAFLTLRAISSFLPLSNTLCLLLSFLSFSFTLYYSLLMTPPYSNVLRNLANSPPRTQGLLSLSYTRTIKLSLDKLCYINNRILVRSMINILVYV